MGGSDVRYLTQPAGVDSEAHVLRGGKLPVSVCVAVLALAKLGDAVTSHLTTLKEPCPDKSKHDVPNSGGVRVAVVLRLAVLPKAVLAHVVHG